MPPSTPPTPAVPGQDVPRDEQPGPVVGSAPTGSPHSPIRKTVRDIALSMGIVAGIIAVAMIVSSCRVVVRMAAGNGPKRRRHPLLDPGVTRPSERNARPPGDPRECTTRECTLPPVGGELAGIWKLTPKPLF